MPDNCRWSAVEVDHFINCCWRFSVEADIVKGHYADYDTFLGEEAVNALRAYLEQRRRGSPDGKIPPETITDDTPLIRDIHDSRKARPIGEKQIGKLVKISTTKQD